MQQHITPIPDTVEENNWEGINQSLETFREDILNKMFPWIEFTPKQEETLFAWHSIAQKSVNSLNEKWKIEQEEKRRNELREAFRAIKENEFEKRKQEGIENQN